MDVVVVREGLPTTVYRDGACYQAAAQSFTVPLAVIFAGARVRNGTWTMEKLPSLSRTFTL